MIIGIIPARAGSKRLPGKNVKMLRGKMLIDYTLKSAQKCKGTIDEVIITTNSLIAIETSKYFQKENPEYFKISHRPEFLCQDDSKTEDVILYELRHYPDNTIVVLLQPTTPLRNHNDILVCIDLFRQEKSDLVLTVRQSENKKYITVNGAVYVFTLGYLREYLDIYHTRKITVYIMPDNRSIDIDTIEDFKAAEKILRRKWKDKQIEKYSASSIEGLDSCMHGIKLYKECTICGRYPKKDE